MSPQQKILYYELPTSHNDFFAYIYCNISIRSSTYGKENWGDTSKKGWIMLQNSKHDRFIVLKKSVVLIISYFLGKLC